MSADPTLCPTPYGYLRLDLVGRALEQGYAVTRLSRHTWAVDRYVPAIATYTVTFAPTEEGTRYPGCTCTAGQNATPCKHVALVTVLDLSGAVPIPAADAEED